MAQRPVSSNPKPIIDIGWEGAAYVRNVGPSPIYIDDIANPVAGQAIDIQPGGWKLWDAGKPLYAVCPTNDGYVNVTRSGGASGGTSRDYPSAIYNKSFNNGQSISPASGVSTTIEALDMRSFVSYSLATTEANSTIQTNSRLWRVDWYADAALQNFITSDYHTVYVYGGVMEILENVKGAYMVINVTGATTVGTPVISIAVTGYLRNVITPRKFIGTALVNSNGGIPNDTDSGWGGWAVVSGASLATGAQLTEYPRLYVGGLADLAVSGSFAVAPAANAGYIRVDLTHPFSGTRLRRLLYIPPGAQTEMEAHMGPFPMPDTAVAITVRNTTGQPFANYTVNLTMAAN